MIEILNTVRNREGQGARPPRLLDEAGQALLDAGAIAGQACDTLNTKTQKEFFQDIRRKLHEARKMDTLSERHAAVADIFKTLEEKKQLKTYRDAAESVQQSLTAWQTAYPEPKEPETDRSGESGPMPTAGAGTVPPDFNFRYGTLGGGETVSYAFGGVQNMPPQTAPRPQNPAAADPKGGKPESPQKKSGFLTRAFAFAAPIAAGVAANWAVREGFMDAAAASQLAGSDTVWTLAGGLGAGLATRALINAGRDRKNSITSLIGGAVLGLSGSVGVIVFDAMPQQMMTTDMGRVVSFYSPLWMNDAVAPFNRAADSVVAARDAAVESVHNALKWVQTTPVWQGFEDTAESASTPPGSASAPLPPARP